jgi:PUA-domain protein
MSEKYRRYTLKSKESKQLLADAAQKLKFDLDVLFGGKVNVETVEAEWGALLLIDGKPVLYKVDNAVFPTLNSKEIISKLPKAVVDMGAVKFVCNGADVMAKGITKYEGTFAKGDVIVVVDAKFGKPLALGEALYNSEEAAAVKQGPAIKNRHYVSDKVWNFAKSLSE